MLRLHRTGLSQAAIHAGSTVRGISHVSRSLMTVGSHPCMACQSRLVLPQKLNLSTPSSSPRCFSTDAQSPSIMNDDSIVKQLLDSMEENEDDANQSIDAQETPEDDPDDDGDGDDGDMDPSANRASVSDAQVSFAAQMAKESEAEAAGEGDDSSAATAAEDAELTVDLLRHDQTAAAKNPFDLVADEEERDGELDAAEEEAEREIDSIRRPEAQDVDNPVISVAHAMKEQWMIEKERMQLKSRALLWHLHKEKKYSEVVRTFESMMYGRTTKIRTAIRNPSALYHYFHSLSQLNQYDRIIAYFRRSLLWVILASPPSLDIFLTACMREPRSAPIHMIYRSMLEHDTVTLQQHRETAAFEEKQSYKKKIRTQKKNKNASLTAKSSTTDATEQPEPTLLITEKAVNKLLKAMLFSGRPQQAYDVWFTVVHVESKESPFTSTTSPSSPSAADLLDEYRKRGYRLHAQSSYGLIMYLLSRCASMDNRPLHHTMLLHSFQMYLQTSFIEGVIDKDLLLRIFNSILRSVHVRLSWHMNLSIFDPNLWLASRIYRFILHHNETLMQAERKKHEDTIQISDGKNRSPSSPSVSMLPDSPWSHPSHPSYVSLNWMSHLRPMLICAIVFVRIAKDHRSRLLTQTRTPSKQAFANADQRVNSGWRLLRTVLYDIRVSYPDYDHMRESSKVELSKEEEEEIDELEAREEELQSKLNLIRDYEPFNPATSVGSHSHRSKSTPIPFEPIPTIRVLDEETFCALMPIFLMKGTWHELCKLFAIIPGLKRYDSMRRDAMEHWITLASKHADGALHPNNRTTSLSQFLNEIDSSLIRASGRRGRMSAAPVEPISPSTSIKPDVDYEPIMRTTKELFDMPTPTSQVDPRHQINCVMNVLSHLHRAEECVSLLSDLYPRFQIQPTPADYFLAIRSLNHPSHLDVLIRLDAAMELDRLCVLEQNRRDRLMVLLEAYLSLFPQPSMSKEPPVLGARHGHAWRKVLATYKSLCNLSNPPCPIDIHRRVFAWRSQHAVIPIPEFHHYVNALPISSDLVSVAAGPETTTTDALAGVLRPLTSIEHIDVLVYDPDAHQLVVLHPKASKEWRTAKFTPNTLTTESMVTVQAPTVIGNTKTKAKPKVETKAMTEPISSPSTKHTQTPEPTHTNTSIPRERERVQLSKSLSALRANLSETRRAMRAAVVQQVKLRSKATAAAASKKARAPR